MSENKVYQVNWNVFGTIEVEAINEEEAREIVQNMKGKELEDKILQEAANGFDIGTIEEVKPYKFISEIIEELSNATVKYGIDNVELLVSEEEEMFYIHYHSRHDSFPIGDSYAINDYDPVDIEELKRKCNERGFDFERM